jgi:hypothetical protein
MVVVPLAMNIA